MCVGVARGTNFQEGEKEKEQLGRVKKKGGPHNERRREEKTKRIYE